jgi:hypothetical protein
LRSHSPSFPGVEDIMRALEALSGLLEKLKSTVVSPAADKFTCGDCERWERCGMKPSDQCITRAAQIEAESGRPPKRNMLVS